MDVKIKDYSNTELYQRLCSGEFEDRDITVFNPFESKCWPMPPSNILTFEK